MSIKDFLHLITESGVLKTLRTIVPTAAFLGSIGLPFNSQKASKNTEQVLPVSEQTDNLEKRSKYQLSDPDTDAKAGTRKYWADYNKQQRESKKPFNFGPHGSKPDRFRQEPVSKKLVNDDQQVKNSLDTVDASETLVESAGKAYKTNTSSGGYGSHYDDSNAHSGFDGNDDYYSHNNGSGGRNHGGYGNNESYSSGNSSHSSHGSPNSGNSDDGARSLKQSKPADESKNHADQGSHSKGKGKDSDAKEDKKSSKDKDSKDKGNKEYAEKLARYHEAQKAAQGEAARKAAQAAGIPGANQTGTPSPEEVERAQQELMNRQGQNPEGQEPGWFEYLTQNPLFKSVGGLVGSYLLNKTLGSVADWGWNAVTSLFGFSSATPANTSANAAAAAGQAGAAQPVLSEDDKELAALAQQEKELIEAEAQAIASNQSNSQVAPIALVQPIVMVADVPVASPQPVETSAGQAINLQPIMPIASAQPGIVIDMPAASRQPVETSAGQAINLQPIMPIASAQPGIVIDMPAASRQPVETSAGQAIDLQPVMPIASAQPGIVIDMPAASSQPVEISADRAASSRQQVPRVVAAQTTVSQPVTARNAPIAPEQPTVNLPTMSTPPLVPKPQPSVQPLAPHAVAPQVAFVYPSAEAQGKMPAISIHNQGAQLENNYTDQVIDRLENLFRQHCATMPDPTDLQGTLKKLDIFYQELDALQKIKHNDRNRLEGKIKTFIIQTKKVVLDIRKALPESKFGVAAGWVSSWFTGSETAIDKAKRIAQGQSKELMGKFEELQLCFDRYYDGRHNNRIAPLKAEVRQFLERATGGAAPQ